MKILGAIKSLFTGTASSRSNTARKVVDESVDKAGAEVLLTPVQQQEKDLKDLEERISSIRNSSQTLNTKIIQELEAIVLCRQEYDQQAIYECMSKTIHLSPEKEMSLISDLIQRLDKSSLKDTNFKNLTKVVKAHLNVIRPHVHKDEVRQEFKKVDDFFEKTPKDLCDFFQSTLEHAKERYN